MKNRRNDESRALRFVHVRCDGTGYAAEGPGFYVWDEDLDAVLAAARDLCLGCYPAARVRRALLVPGTAKKHTPTRGRIEPRSGRLPLET